MEDNLCGASNMSWIIRKAFKKDFEEAVLANRITRSNQLKKLREFSSQTDSVPTDYMVTLSGLVPMSLSGA